MITPSEGTAHQHSSFLHKIWALNQKEKCQVVEIQSSGSRQGTHPLLSYLFVHWYNGHELGQTPGDSRGQGGLARCSPWGHKELDTTERLNNSSLKPVGRKNSSDVGAHTAGLPCCTLPLGVTTQHISWERLKPPRQWFSKRSLMSSIKVTWELIRNAYSWPHCRCESNWG